MANALTTDWSKLSKELEELARKKDGSKPRIALGKGPTFTTTGTQTISQPIAKFYSEVDTRKLTPFEISQMGGEEEIAKRKESAKKLIASETPSTETLSITGEKKTEAKATPKSATKAKDEKPKPDLYRVMLKGGDSRKDTFFATEEAAKSALEDERARRKAERDYMVQTLGEAETLKRLGKEEKDIGAIAGVRFPAKTKEEKSALELQYMKKSLSGGKAPKAKETEEEAIKRRVREVNPQATPEQQQNYYNTLIASRARGRERGGYAEEYQAAVAKGKTPSAYEERLMSEEARDRRMGDFLARSAAKQIAEQKEKAFKDEYRYLNKIERIARKTKQFDVALEANRGIRELSDMIGTSPSNVSARRKLFQKEAMDEVGREIQARDRLRREKMYKQTTSTPEAKSPSTVFI